MELYIHYTTLPVGKNLEDVVEELNEVLDDGGQVCGVAAIYRAVDEIAGYPVRSIYSIADLPDYQSYDFRDCPYCKAGKKVDALVNSFGFSAL